MKSLLPLFLPWFCAFAAGPSIDTLIDSARALQPEFAADGLIRIAQTKAIEKTRAIDLLDTAFQKAAGAQQPWPRHSVLLRADGQAGYWKRVYAQELDGLSLRLRVVRAMLPLDDAKAVDLFRQIPPPKPRRLSCKEYLVPDVSRLYDVLGEVARHAAEDSRADLFRRYTGAINSPVEIAPAAQALAASHLKDAEFQAAVDSFGAAVGKISGDDRSFASSPTGTAIQLLVEETKRRHLSPLPLLEGYRVYLVFNLSAARCADDDAMESGQQSFGLSLATQSDKQPGNVIEFFNTKLRMPPLQPISELESTPARLEGAAAGVRLCQDAGCRAIAEQYRGLVFTAQGAPLPPGERNTPEWQSKLRAFLAALADWKQAPEVPLAEYYEAKSRTYADLLSLTAEARAREQVLHGFLDFVAGNSFENNNRIEWFLPINGIIGRLSLDPAGSAKLLADVRASKDPVIALYGSLEEAAPRPADRILSLM
jgi:hypothetical protein